MTQWIFIGLALLACSKSLAQTTQVEGSTNCPEPLNKGVSIAGKNPRGKVISCQITVHKALIKSDKVSHDKRLKRNAVHETLLFDQHGNVQEVLGTYLSERDVSTQDKVIKTTYSFDSSNRVMEEATYKVDGSDLVFLRKKVNLYDTIGNLVKILEYQKNEKTRSIVRKIDTNNRTVIEYSYGTDEALASDIISLKYDDRWNELERIELNHRTKNVISTQRKSYDLANNEISYQYEGPISKFECNYVYDEKNNVVDKTCTSPTSTRHNHYEYVYDEHCNWIKRIEFINGIADNVTLRVFEYR